MRTIGEHSKRARLQNSEQKSDKTIEFTQLSEEIPSAKLSELHDPFGQAYIQNLQIATINTTIEIQESCTCHQVRNSPQKGQYSDSFRR